MQDPLSQVAHAQELIQRGPETFVAAFFAVVALALLVTHLRSKDRHQLTVERIQREHQLAMERLMREHAEQVAAIHKEGRADAVRGEVVMHGILEAMPDLKTIARYMRKGAFLEDVVVKTARSKAKAEGDE